MFSYHLRVVIVIVDVACSEAEEWCSGANILVVIVGICDAKMAFILTRVVITVASKGSPR
jgi:hypothetical protein